MHPKREPVPAAATTLYRLGAVETAAAGAAALALVLGEDELAGRSATLKHLREELPQESVAFDELQDWFTNWSASRG